MESKCVLTRLALGHSSEILITDERLDLLRVAKKCVSRMLAVEERFDVLMENYAELEVELLSSTARNVYFSDLSWDQMVGALTVVSRRLINLLAAGRMYVDQVPHEISAMGFDRLPFTTATRGEYDASLGYRALEQLRNYAQHRNLPVHGLSYPWSRSKEKTLTFTVEFTLAIEELRSDGKFKKTILDELAAIDPLQVHLKTLVRAYVASLNRIHRVTRDIAASKLSEWIAAQETAITEYQHQFGLEIMGLAAARIRLEAGQERGVAESISLFAEPWLRLRRLAVKNACSPGLDTHEISSGRGA